MMTQREKAEAVVDVLESARNLIDSPSRWCKNYQAMNREGVDVDCTDYRACRWCMLGAIGHEYVRWVNANLDERAGCYGVHNAAVGFLTQRLPGHEPDEILGEQDIADFNDRVDTHHGDVIRVLDGAIEDARGWSCASA